MTGMPVVEQAGRCAYGGSYRPGICGSQIWAVNPSPWFVASYQEDSGQPDDNDTPIGLTPTVSTPWAQLATVDLCIRMARRASGTFNGGSTERTIT